MLVEIKAVNPILNVVDWSKHTSELKKATPGKISPGTLLFFLR